MEGMELIAFEIISNVGMAKSLSVEALRAVRSGNYEECNKKLEEASGEKIEFSLIIMHAEDQMIAAETIKSLVEEMIDMYKELKK